MKHLSDASNSSQPGTSLTLYRRGSLTNNSGNGSRQQASRGMLQLVGDVTYDVLFAVIVVAHPMWVFLLTWFVFEPVP